MENKQNQSDLHNDMQSDKVQENVQTVEVENDAQVNKAKKDVQINVRMKADTAKRFKALLKEMKLPTQSACIEAMIDICQSSVLSKTKFGQSMEQDIKNFAMHLSALTTIFNASIQRGEDVKQEVIADFKKKYADKDEKIDYYKAKAEDLKKQLDLEKEKHRQTSDDLNKEKAARAAAAQEAESIRQSREYLNGQIKSLNSQIDLLKKSHDADQLRIERAEKAEKEYSELQKKYASATVEAECLRKILDKYIPNK